jgi:hypothetical protein
VLETNHRQTVHVRNVQNVKTVTAGMQRNPRKSTRKAGGYPADLCNEFQITIYTCIHTAGIHCLW